MSDTLRLIYLCTRTNMSIFLIITTKLGRSVIVYLLWLLFEYLNIYEV